jgi:hypothetical protein
MRRQHLAFILLWTLLWALFFGGLLLGRGRLPNGDLSGQFHTFALFQAREMTAGRLPLWSPGSYAGFPFAADTQAAVFYPIRWLTILLGGTAGLSFYALELEGLLHIWLAGLFTYALAYDITRNRWAGLLAAVAFGLGGYLISYPLLQLALLETITWLPLILWLLRQGIARREERPLPWLLAAGLLLGLSFTAGHPQTFLHLSYLAAVYYLFLAVRARWAWRWLVGLGLLIGGTAVGLAAAAWLPALHYLAYTTRSDVSYEFVATGFPLLDYVQLLMPGLFSFWLPMYGGAAVIVLIIAGWLARAEADASQKSEMAFWSSAALVVIILSLGDKGILFELLYRLAPGFALFRQQERLVGLLALALALLAAQGFALWQQSAGKERLLGRLTAVSLTLFLFTTLIIAITAPGDWRPLLAQQALFLLATLLILWRGGGRWSGPALVLLLSLDLFLAARQPLNLQPESPAVFWPQPEWLSLLQADEPGRIDSNGLVHANLGELTRLEDIRGISPLKLRWLSRIEDLPAVRRWQLLNVTHTLASVPPEGVNVHEVTAVNTSLIPGETFNGYLYRFEEALPRAWLVYEPVLANDEEHAFELVAQPEFEPARQVVLTGLEDVAAWTALASASVATSPPPQPSEVKTRRTAANALQIQAATATPGILVISEWDYPGWRVLIDGNPATTATANAAFQAVLLPAGEHTITLRFMPPDVYLGIALSLLTLLLVGVLAWRWRPVIGQRQSYANHLPDWRIDPDRLWLVGQQTSIDGWSGDWSGDFSRKVTAKASIDGWSGDFSRKVTAKASTPIIQQNYIVRLLDERRWLWGVTAVLLLGFGLRLFYLGHQELRGDEAFSYLFARLPAADIIPALIGEGDPHSPFHYLLLHGWLGLAGDSEFAMRYLSLLPGVLLLPLLYVLGATMGSRRIGLLAALLAAVSKSLIWLAQDVRNQYTLVLFFGTLATVLLTRELVPERNVTRRRWWLWLVYGLVLAAAVYSHYYGLFIVLAHALYLWWPSVGRVRRWGMWLLAGVTAALLFAPWLLLMWRQLLAAGQLSDPTRPELAAYLVEVGIELTLGSGLDGWLVRWLFGGTLLLALLGLWALLRQKPAWAALLGGWWGFTTLFIYLIRYNRATFNPFYISIAAPAWWLLVATGLLLLWRQRWPGWRVLAAVGLGLLLLANGLSLKNYYVDPAYGRTLGYREMAAHLAARAEPGDVFLAHFPDPALDYYLRHLDMPTRMLPVTAEATQAETEAALFELSQTAGRLWFVPYHSSVWDRENIVPRWLDYHTLHEERVAADRLTLWAYRPLPTVMESMAAQETVFGEQIRLNGVYVTVDGQPVNLEETIIVGPESAVVVTLLWEGTAEIPENYTVFVHLLADDGTLIAQHDGVPMFGTRPTTTWQPGELLLDRHELVLPAQGMNGEGRLVVGLYQSETFAPLLTAQGEEKVEIGRLRD